MSHRNIVLEERPTVRVFLFLLVFIDSVQIKYLYIKCTVQVVEIYILFFFLFYILGSLDRLEGRNRAESGLFFILMTFLCLNFKKISFGGKDISE
jgi:hypothetical protein